MFSLNSSLQASTRGTSFGLRLTVPNRRRNELFQLTVAVALFALMVAMHAFWPQWDWIAVDITSTGVVALAALGGGIPAAVFALIALPVAFILNPPPHFLGEWLEWAVIAGVMLCARWSLTRLRASESKLRAFIDSDRALKEGLEARVAERTSELRESEGRYRSVFDQAQEIIYTLSHDGMIASLNPAFEKVLGWSPDAWIGKPFIGLIPAESREGTLELFATLLKDGSVPPSRVMVLAKDGRRVPLEVTLSEQILESKSVGFLGAGRDISRREQAEEKMRRSERQLADAERVAKVGSFEHDLKSGTLWWSPQLFRILGLQPNSGPMSFSTWMEMVVEEDRPKIAEAERMVAALGEHQWEIRMRSGDGREIVAACAGRLVSDGASGTPRVVGVVRDVTAAKRAEQQLRESQERFRLLAQATSDAVYDLDVTSGRVWRGDGYETLFGYARGELAADVPSWAALLHPDDSEAVQQSYKQAIDSGQSSWTHEYRFRRADGSYANILDHAFIVRDSEKRPTRMLGAMVDITERKLLLDQLEQAKRVSSLGRVAASIAHEFNNVLMGIQPNVEVIRRSSPAGLRNVTDSILRAVQRGKRVTDEILRYTRPAEPILQCVNVKSFFDRWKEEIVPLLGPAVNLELVADEDAHVMADGLQLAQVFTNLALNARDAMLESGGKLIITAKNSTSFASFPFGVVKSPDRFVHFVVRDEGCGMNADRLGHMFEPLFTTKKGGIGLGLAITYQIVTRHDGHIFVESEVGDGSAFHVFIPGTLPQIADTDAPSRSSLEGLRKLVLVEDEPAVASGIAMLMEMDGVTVETVYTGRESIDAIERVSPDAVILDIGLPDMDGVGVYLEIQRRWPELPVLFSSGHGDSNKLETYLARPNVGFILKPYQFEDMRVALGRLLQPTASRKAFAG